MFAPTRSRALPTRLPAAPARTPARGASWLGTMLVGLSLAAGCGVELAWPEPSADLTLPAPSSFLAAATIVAVVLVGHAFAVLGARRAGLLLATVALLAVMKERSNPADEYVVLLPRRLPLAVAGGWLVTVLLSLDFARRAQRLLWPTRPARAVPQIVLMSIFAWQLSLAIEPLGQAAGWWSWTEAVRQGRFPVADTGGPWLVMTSLFGSLGLVAAADRGRRAKLALQLLGATLAVVAATPVLAIPLLGIPAVGGMLLGMTRADERWLGVEIEERISPAYPTPGRAAWIDRLPLACLVVICWTLGVYAVQLDVPGWSACLLPVLALSGVTQLGLDLRPGETRRRLRVPSDIDHSAPRRALAPRGMRAARVTARGRPATTRARPAMVPRHRPAP